MSQPNKRARSEGEIKVVHDAEMEDAQAVLGRCPLMMVVVALGEHQSVGCQRQSHQPGTGGQ